MIVIEIDKWGYRFLFITYGVRYTWMFRLVFWEGNFRAWLLLPSPYCGMYIGWSSVLWWDSFHLLMQFSFSIFNSMGCLLRNFEGVPGFCSCHLRLSEEWFAQSPINLRGWYLVTLSLSLFFFPDNRWNHIFSFSVYPNLESLKPST